MKRRRCFTDPHYWKNPALRRSREEGKWFKRVHDFSEHRNTSYFASITCNIHSQDHDPENLVRCPKHFFLTHLQSICSEQVALEKNTFVSNVSLKFTWNVELNCLLQPLLQRGILVGRKHSGLKPVRRCSLHTLCKAIIASPRVPIPGPFCKSQRPHHTYMNQNTPGRRWQCSLPSGSSRN